MQFAEDRDGYVSVSEAKQFGIAQTYLVLAEQEGQFDKVAKGLYVKKGYPIDPHYIIHYRYPKALFQLTSAAYLHNWLPNDKLLMSVKCPRNYMTSGIEGCVCTHASKKDYEIGIGITLTRNGLIVATTDKERTIIDFIKHKNEFEPSMVKTVLENALSSDINWELLYHYGELLGCKEELELLHILFKD